MPAISIWTDERIALLKRLWAEGYSCSQIASEMASNITRNAVIGKVHRLGLISRRDSPNRNCFQRAIDPVRSRAGKSRTARRTVFKSREIKPRLRLTKSTPGLLQVQSAITGQLISVRGHRRGPAPEMTKNELRNMLSKAVQNTAAMEIA